MTRILLTVGLLMGLAACETAQGFGRDVENTGELIEDAAE